MGEPPAEFKEIAHRALLLGPQETWILNSRRCNSSSRRRPQWSSMEIGTSRSLGSS